jgi:hypothetical protein
MVAARYLRGRGIVRMRDVERERQRIEADRER